MEKTSASIRTLIIQLLGFAKDLEELKGMFVPCRFKREHWKFFLVSLWSGLGAKLKVGGQSQDKLQKPTVETGQESQAFH